MKSPTSTCMTTKQQAYALIDRLPPRQLIAVVGLLESMLLESMLEPVPGAVAGASSEDDRSEQQRLSAAKLRTWLA